MFSTKDPINRTVTCSSDTWSNHITSGHPIMTENHSAVKNTIERPDVIYQSSSKPTRDVYFSRTESTYYPLYTKVVVQFNETNNSGEVVSAWPQPNISGGIDPEVIKYVKSKL